MGFKTSEHHLLPHSSRLPRPYLYLLDSADVLSEVHELYAMSPDLQHNVACVRKACTQATATLPGQKACECATLQQACNLGVDTLDAPTRAFCASLRIGSACRMDELELAMREAVTPHVLRECFHG